MKKLNLGYGRDGSTAFRNVKEKAISQTVYPKGKRGWSLREEEEEEEKGLAEEREW